MPTFFFSSDRDRCSLYSVIRSRLGSRDWVGSIRNLTTRYRTMMAKADKAPAECLKYGLNIPYSANHIHGYLLPADHLAAHTQPRARQPGRPCSHILLKHTLFYASVLQITSQPQVLLRMGCTQSKAVEIDVPPTLPVATAPTVAARVTPAPPPAPPIVEESSPAAVSRRPSRRSSTRGRPPAHQEESSSQARKRASSAPGRPPQALQVQEIPQMPSSSSQPSRPRTKSQSAPRGHRRSQSNTPVPGECYGWLGHQQINPH